MATIGAEEQIRIDNSLLGAPVGRGKESLSAVHGAGVTSLDSARTRSSSSAGFDFATSDLADADLMVNSFVEDMTVDEGTGAVHETRPFPSNKDDNNNNKNDRSMASSAASNASAADVKVPIFDALPKPASSRPEGTTAVEGKTDTAASLSANPSGDKHQPSVVALQGSSIEGVVMHAPALLFPSPRQEGALLPSTYRMSIQQGAVVSITSAGAKTSSALVEGGMKQAPSSEKGVQPLPQSPPSTVPLMPVKKYPLPEIRTIHSATFRAPHVFGGAPSLSATTTTAAGAASHPAEEWSEIYASPSATGAAATAPYSPPRVQRNTSAQFLTFSTPSKKELASVGMSGVPHATEVLWERRPPGQVRRPLNVTAPSPQPPESNEPELRISPPAPPVLRQELDFSNGPSSAGRGNGSSGVRNSRSSSSLSDEEDVSSEASEPLSDNDDDMDDYDYHHLSQSRPAAASGPQSWKLFESLVNEAGHGSRKMERQRERSYNCPWYRIGYYRRCEDKYQDPAVYDSEDSEYEEPTEKRDLSNNRGALRGPFSSDFKEVRAMMLELDVMADRPVPGGVPKYFRDWGKKLRRQSTLRQQRLRREKEREQREYEGVPSYRPSSSNKHRGESGGSGKSSGGNPRPSGSGKSSGGGQKKTRIPGMPAPKRQSTALTLSYELQSNGLIRCKRCGKRNFKNEFALRSHLSHCPGTIHMKEQRMKIEAGILPPETLTILPVEDLDTGANALPAWVPAFSGSSLGGSDHHHHHRHSSSVAASSSSAAVHEHHDSKMAASVMYRDDCESPGRHRSDSMDSPYPPPPPVFEGTPLVPETVEDGDSLIGRTISFRNRLVHDWTDALVRNYRSRRNSHLIVYSDSTAEWVVLTDRNCRLEAGYRGIGGPGSQLESDNENGSLNGFDRMYSRDRSDSFAGSGDDLNGSNKRRSSRSGDLAASSSLGMGGPSGTDSEQRNAFFNQHDTLITPRRPTNKRKSDSIDGNDSNSGSDRSVTYKYGNNDDQRKLVRIAPSSGHQHQQQQQHQNSPHLSPQHPYASNKAGKAISPYTGMSISTYQATASIHQMALTTFSCRRCNHTFHNKQALGWHTRKGCIGPSPLPFSSSSGSSSSAMGGSGSSMY